MQTIVGLTLLALCFITAIVCWWNGRKPNKQYRFVHAHILNATHRSSLGNYD